ncbi:MAG: endonuclease V [Bacteroidetes bacterium]|nr:endonuclease V [Bacteroidota bacterium]
MIYAFDTFYEGLNAKTVCIGFEEWTSTDYNFLQQESLEIQSEYISGEFYKRELPCILSLLGKMTLSPSDMLIIDGYVYLDDYGKLGLGGHLNHSLDGKIPVIGVAKTNFATIFERKKEILRGKSQKPIYVTSIGIDLSLAAELVGQMAGIFRMPDLLKKLDLLTKS